MSALPILLASGVLRLRQVANWTVEAQMTVRASYVLFAGALSLVSAAVAYAQSANDRVTFPESYKGGVHYGTVTRGTIREELYTSQDAIDAARAGKPFPDGTVITMEDHRRGGLHRYVVMEKRAGWGKLSPAAVRAGDWLFREFAADQTPKRSEDGSRCMTCHQSQAAQDFVFTVDEMKSAN